VSVKNVPLDPRVIQEIEDTVSDLPDGPLRDEFRRKLRRQAQQEANDGAADRKVFREALDLAKREGYADPEAYARIQVEKRRVMNTYEQQNRATFKRIEDLSRKRANKRVGALETASKTAQPSKRRFPQRDRQYVDLIGKAERGEWLGDEPLVLSKIAAQLGHYRLPHWEKTTVSLKVMAMSVVSAKQGAQTLNLHLSPEQCSQALGSPRGPASYMQQRIRNALEKAFGREDAPDFWFTIETDWGNNFHLHGAVVTPELEGARDLVDQALRSAGGKWASDGGQQFQQLSAGLDDPIYWASYTLKHMNVSALELPRKLFGSTLGISTPPVKAALSGCKPSWMLRS